VRKVEPGVAKNVLGGLWFPSEANINPKKLIRYLRDLCLAKNV
jgi:glycine/D-amino acid oxidase-like deaminating enzyme